MCVRYAADAQDTRRLLWLFMTRRRCRCPTCCATFGAATTPPRATVRQPPTRWSKGVRISVYTHSCVFLSSATPQTGQGHDRGTQYRSGVYTNTKEEHEVVKASLRALQPRLQAKGFGPITTEIKTNEPRFYYAETYHQQYLAKPGSREVARRARGRGRRLVM